MHGPVDTIVFMVSSYQGHTLEWISNAYCRLVDEGGDGPDVEVARFTLTGGTSQTGMAISKLTRDGEGWRFHAIGEGIPATVPSKSVEALRPYV